MTFYGDGCAARIASCPPPQPDPEHARTVLFTANELGSPLHPVEGVEGDFSKRIRLLAQVTGMTICGQERERSADTAFDPSWARVARQPNTVQTAAHTALNTVMGQFPDTERIVVFAHSAGADHAIQIVKAAGLHELEGRSLITDLVVMDYPRGRHTLLGGLLRYGLYERIKRRYMVEPGLPEEMLPAAPGASQRSLFDARYNMRRWAKGATRDLEWIAQEMPDVAIHVFMAEHSPNNIFRWPGSLKRYIERINGLRGGMVGAAVCHAEVHPGPHGDGSRARVAAQLLRRAGVIKPPAST